MYFENSITKPLAFSMLSSSGVTGGGRGASHTPGKLNVKTGTPLPMTFYI